MISQVINLSNEKTFKLFKEKYDYSIPFYKGLYGVEIRKIQSGILNQAINTNCNNIYYKNDGLLFTGSFNEVRQQVSSPKLEKELKSVIIRSFENFDRNENIFYQIGNRSFNFKQSYVMGILNITPDSFSDGGKFIDKSKAVEYAMKMYEEGVDIIDVGGESTRPSSEAVSESEEIDRVIPVISEILKRKSDAIISIDTTKASVAQESLRKGALIVNDISGGTFEPEMFDVVKEFDAAMVIMHIKGKPKTMQDNPKYDEVVSDVYDYLIRQTNTALEKGIEKIFIDPGIGFGKRVEDNLSLIERLEDFKSIGLPILIGLSRKSFIGNILNLSVEDRDDPTNALNLLVLNKGARIIRSHNIKQAVQTCKIFNRIITN